MGAYIRTNGGVVPAKAAQFLPGPYRIRDVAITVEALMTSKTPVGTVRAPGRFEANFFRERLIDMAARDLGLDPMDFRRKNLIREAELPFATGKLCIPRSSASTSSSVSSRGVGWRASSSPPCAGLAVSRRSSS